MLSFNQLFSALIWAIILMRPSDASRLNDAEIIWRAGMPIEAANVALHRRVVESLQRDAKYPLTGLEWNAWYPREIERFRADREAYFRSARETHAEAARLGERQRQ
uniref:Uncharacterized protein n=1 Tax=Kalmanozyma brasiliensis (strain GHG001) TaxID=1365824 RepID=V5GGN0_KALBG